MSLAKQILEAVMSSDNGRLTIVNLLKEASAFADLCVTNMENECADCDVKRFDGARLYDKACDELADMAADLDNAAVAL